MIRKKLPLIIGIILGIAAIFLIRQYIQQERIRLMRAAQRKSAETQKDLVSVVVAKTEIPPGAIIEARSLDMQLVPVSAFHPETARSLERVIGMMAVLPISKGEQILLSKLTSAGRVISLAVTTPVGKRAITVPIDNISSVGGMVRPGDYVDIMGVIDVPAIREGKQVTQMTIIPLFQNVLVLAMGSQLIGDSPPSVGRGEVSRETPAQVPPTVTLALSPQGASLLAFISEQGKIRLILRSPVEDSQIQPMPLASWDTLFQYLYPEMVERERPVEEAPKEKLREIEIYRGLKRETLPLEK